MSKEYINRDMVAELVGNYIAVNTDKPPECSLLYYLVNNLAPADVAPVVHGKWIYDHWCEFKCSICGHWSNTIPRGKEKYCPNCGAKMDGGSK